MKQSKSAASSRPYRRFALAMADSPRIESRLNAILTASLRRLARPKRSQTLATAATAAVTLLTLAALHIVGKEPRAYGRSAASAAAGAPPESGQPAGRPPATPKTFAETLPPQKRWTREVPGTGVSAELLGVSLTQKVPAPPPDSPAGTTPIRHNVMSQMKIIDSWSPDGVRYSQMLCPSDGASYGGILKSKDGKEQRFVELLVRVRNESKQDFHLSNETHGTSGASTTLLTNQGHPNYSGDTLWRISLTNPEEQKRLRLQLSLAAGEYPYRYDEAVPLTAPFAQRVGGVKIGGLTTEISYTGPVLDKRGNFGFAVTYSGLASYDTRIVVVDAQGQEISPLQMAATGGKDFTSVNLFFDPKQVSQARIAKIRLEARPYQKIAFDDVALYPKEAGK